MYNLTFEFILHLYSFFRCFLFFFIPVEGLCCRPKYWANIIHRFDDQNSLTSKCIENWALFERLTHSQRSALSLCSEPGWGPRGSAQRKAIEGQQISKFTLLVLNSSTALLLNLPESKLTRDCVSRLVRVRR